MATTATNSGRQNHPQFSDFPQPTHTVSHEHISAYTHNHHHDAPTGYHAPHHISSDPTPLAHSQSHPVPLPSRHTHSFPHPHIATPHPMAAALGYLDNHVPAFAKHHKEFTVQHDFRRAKRDARKSIDSPIPEAFEEPNSVIMTEEEEKRRFELEERARHEKEEQSCKDNEAWEEVLREREAARRRSGSTFER